MKKIAKFGLLVLLLGTMITACEVRAGYVVRVRPVEPYYVQPVAPYADAIWIPGEWEWRAGRYAFVQGYYIHRRPGRQWIAGHWNSTPRGYAWERGHWR